MSDMRKFLSLAFVSAVAAGLFACGGDSSSSGPDVNDDVVESSSGTKVESSSYDDLESSESGIESESSGSGVSSSASTQSSFSAGEDRSLYDAENNTLTDLRDGQVYRTTTISIPTLDYSEVWMAENLNYETGNSFCYGDNPDKCNTYGRLYTWAAAVGKTEEECCYEHCNLPSGNIRGVCPMGWHLPSYSEWEALIVAVDGSITEYEYDNTAGKRLKSISGWIENGNGIDSYSFSAFPAGDRSGGGGYNYEGDNAFFWSPVENGSSNAFGMYLNDYYDKAFLYDFDKYYGFSVRCLKD